MDTMVALNIGQNIYYLALYRKSLLTLALWHSVGQSDCYKEIFNDQTVKSWKRSWVCSNPTSQPTYVWSAIRNRVQVWKRKQKTKLILP